MRDSAVTLSETQGRIITSVGGLYTVETSCGMCTCKARGVFRKRGILPYVGDFVQLSEDGVICEILPRKNSILRPPVANLDQILFVTSSCRPDPNLLLLDSFLAVAIYQNIQPVLVLTKVDLDAAEQVRRLYASAGIPVYAVDYRNGETVQAVAALLKDKVSMMTGNSGVGKSSLLNALCGYDRVIVTDVAGTTRDTVEESVTLGRHLLRLLDTAGIHETDDRIEKLGVERAVEAVRSAELAIFVCDRSRALNDADREAMRAAMDAPHSIAVLNKSDLPAVLQPSDLPFDCVVPVCAKTGEGLDLFEQALDLVFPEGTPCDGSILTNERQADAVLRAGKSLDAALTSLRQGVTPDAVLVDVEAAMSALGEVTGRTMREDITNRIFERFCVGK